MQIIYPIYYGPSIDISEYKIIELELQQEMIKKKPKKYQWIIVRDDHETLMECISTEELERLLEKKAAFSILGLVTSQEEFQEFVQDTMDLLVGSSKKITRQSIRETRQGGVE